MAHVLTFDLGTSATKAALWSDAELVALARSPVATTHPEPGRAEQDPLDWWRSVVDSCAQVRAASPARFVEVTAIGFSATRETFTLLDDDLRPIGPGVLWSDQRAGAEAAELGDPSAFRAATGVVGNGASHAAKVLWVARHRADDLDAARWVAAPRDAVIAWLTGELVTDVTLASRTGWFELAGGWTADAEERLGRRLPRVLASTEIVGALRADPAGALGLSVGTVVVAGAGDRQCEALGVGATSRTPMVSWGTTTNVSAPHPGPVDELPTVAAVSRSAQAEPFLVEAGLSASGAALEWLATLTGRDRDDLLDLGAEIEPGSRGVIALPWLHGARGPWWAPETHAAFLGLTAAHGPAELARATVEAVALDVARCIDLLDLDVDGLALAGAGAAGELWRTVLAATTARPWIRRRHDDAASVGARLIVAAALGERIELDAINPIVASCDPDHELVEAYRLVRAHSDAAAVAVLSTPPTRQPK